MTQPRKTPFERLADDVQLRRALLALHSENTPMAISDVGEILGAPTRLTRSLLDRLAYAGRAIPVATSRGLKYKPALRDPLLHYLRTPKKC
jgi:hypothetical protein